MRHINHLYLHISVDKSVEAAKGGLAFTMSDASGYKPVFLWYYPTHSWDLDIINRRASKFHHSLIQVCKQFHILPEVCNG